MLRSAGTYAILNTRTYAATGSPSSEVWRGSMTGNLSVDAQVRYLFISELLRTDFPPPARIVELGSAPGDQIAQLAGLGYYATSVDIGTSSDAWGGGEKGRMEELLARAGVESVHWDLEEVPYPLESASFDAVIMTEVYEHLREYPVRSLQEIHRILRPGGRLYFTTPNAAYLVNRVRLLAGRNVSTGLAEWIGGVPHARHSREYTFAEVQELMAYANLQVVSATSRHFHLDSGRTDSLAMFAKQALNVLSRVRPTLGPQIVVIAER
jgi:SAM-dependent methyltransferase